MNFSNVPFTTNASDAVSSSARLPAEPAAIITVAALAIVGNFLVLVATTRRQTFPSASRLFIVSMAWSDLLHGSIFPFLVAPARAGEWVYSHTAAQAIVVIGASSVATTAFALAGLNVDRLCALKNDGVGISRKKAWIFLISTWAGVYAFYIFSTVYGVPVYYDPVMALPSYDLKAHIWFSIVMFIIICSPLIVTLYCVVRILRALCAQNEPPAAQAAIYINVVGAGGSPPQNAPQQQPAPQNDTSDRSYAKVVLILTLVQIIMQLPAICAFVVSQLPVGDDLPTFVFWSAWLGLSNIFLDVVVYSVCQKSFRIAVKETAISVVSCMHNVCCRRNRVNVDDQQNIDMSNL
uniref:G-protein coupled receptors family 1 profile domain-containing protein n=1 Tax=Branchiostoma floridae TaxID=7739 RepID=C3ZH60_BRAFL|eukprot:XP_002592196.1 hypothetical protein BRAFLDRAFT_84622 [Branchiostoma floridae]